MSGLGDTQDGYSNISCIVGNLNITSAKLVLDKVSGYYRVPGHCTDWLKLGLD